METPAVTLPKGGGAIRSIGEKFAANPVTGTASVTIPLATSPARSGFGPQLTLVYDSGTGNGVLGAGWQLAPPEISRRVDKGVPRYDASDVFVLTGSEDLVKVGCAPSATHRIDLYRPRTEGLFARIERWTAPDGEVHWRTISRDNVTSIFADRVREGARVFRWLLSESYDDRGNWILYGYKWDGANAYPKWIRYGNRVSRLVKQDKERAGFCFEVVFDYGEHDEHVPTPRESGLGKPRDDPFSDRRAGFELRMRLLLRRVLMFHHFPGREGVGTDCLVRSTDLSYHDSPVMSVLASVTQRGYRRHGPGYAMASLPAVEFEYSQPVLSTKIRAVAEQDVPAGLDGEAARLIDFDGDGVSGILTRHAGTWFYRENQGGGRFAPFRAVGKQPVLAGTSLMDLAGDGSLSLVGFEGTTPGFAKREDGEWRRFKAFASLPRIDWQDKELRFADLTGDGRADLVRLAGGACTWHESLGEQGFDAAKEVIGPAREHEKLFLADMSGDGLVDIVHVGRRGVCYWPSLGHGRFGAMVAMDNAPEFGDDFDPARIRLIDIDGSGSADIVYCGRQGIQLFANQAGNAWSAGRTLPLPLLETHAFVQTGDLLGTGTACLIWSSPLPSRQPARFVDLTGGVKPHLLTVVRNNLGARTAITYASSASFFLADKAKGQPWVTKLPFPVHVVARVESHDELSGSVSVARYEYHHGYYDGHDREFRGFGRVDRYNTGTREGGSLTRTLLSPDQVGQREPAVCGRPSHADQRNPDAAEQQHPGQAPGGRW